MMILPNLYLQPEIKHEATHITVSKFGRCNIFNFFIDPPVLKTFPGHVGIFLDPSRPQTNQKKNLNNFEIARNNRNPWKHVEKIHGAQPRQADMEVAKPRRHGTYPRQRAGVINAMGESWGLVSVGSD